MDAALAEEGSAAALNHRGKAAVGNAKLAYGRYREIFNGPEFADYLQRAFDIGDPNAASNSSLHSRLTKRFPGRLALIFRGAATADLPSADAISTIDVPTLILAWTGDPGHPANSAARLQELMPHAELALAATPVGLASWTERATGFLAQF